MINDTMLLLDLDGVSVMRVERCEGGRRRVHLTTADAWPGLSGLRGPLVPGERLRDHPAPWSPLWRAWAGALVAQAALVVP